MKVLRIAFPRGAFTEEETGLSGLELAFSLMKEKDTVVILSPGSEAVRASQPAVTSFVFFSPVTGALTLGYAPLSAGYALRSEGLDAVVLTGRARVLSLVSIAERNVSDAHLYRDLGNRELSGLVQAGGALLSVGRAAMNGVLHASLRGEGAEIPELGAVLARKGIKGLLFPAAEIKAGSKKARFLSRHARDFLREGERSLIDADIRLGTLPVGNWSSGRDPRAYFLDEKAARDSSGPFPGYQAAKMLGTNLSVFDSGEVMELADAVAEAGLDTAYAGAVLAGKSLDRKGRLELVETLAEGMQVKGGAFLSESGQPFTLDLRGSLPDAIACSLGLPPVLLSSRVMPLRPLGRKAAAELAVRELAYGFALLSEGYSPAYALETCWGRIPSVCYHIPHFPLLLLLSKRDMLRKGLALLEKLENGPYRLPGLFRLSPLYGRSVNQTLLMSEYRHQKARLRMLLNVRSENTFIPSGDSRAAVGPADDLGREGEPGFSTNTPFWPL